MQEAWLPVWTLPLIGWIWAGLGLFGGPVSPLGLDDLLALDILTIVPP